MKNLPKKLRLKSFLSILLLILLFCLNSFSQLPTLKRRPPTTDDSKQTNNGNSVGVSLILKRTLTGLNGWAQSVKFSPDGKTILAGSPTNDKSGGVARLWDATNGQIKLDLKWNSGAFQDAVFSSDGKFVAIKTGQDGGSDFVDAEDQISIADAQTGNLVRVFNPPYGSLDQFFSMVAFSPDNKSIIISNAYGEHTGEVRSRKLEFWDIQTGKKKMMFEGIDGLFDITQDGKTAMAESCSKAGTTIEIWDLYTGKLKQKLITNTGQNACDSIAFSTDRKTLITGVRYDSVTDPAKVWNVQTGKLKLSLQGAKAPFAFSPDGRTLASRGIKKGTILLWDMKSGKVSQELIGHTDSVLALDFSSDGKMLVSGSQDRLIKIWEYPIKTTKINSTF